MIFLKIYISFKCIYAFLSILTRVGRRGGKKKEKKKKSRSKKEKPKEKQENERIQEVKKKKNGSEWLEEGERKIEIR